jgi:Uma2 family endonuclease
MITRIGARTYQFAEAKNLGWVLIQGLFQINPQADPLRRPEVAFVSYDRWPRRKQIPDRIAWDVVPNFVVEVVSPIQDPSEKRARVREYLEAGVDRVWVIHTARREVTTYDASGDVEVFRSGEAKAVLQPWAGLSFPLAELFRDLATDSHVA